MERASLKKLLSAKDIQKEDINALIQLAAQFYEGFKQDKRQFHHLAKGRLMASLFFEASTRTRFSFEAAMYRLGGEILTLENGASSSVKKGETLSDMGRIVSGYADIIVMRHPEAGSVAEFAKHAHVPVINAGDGPQEHPSQSLLDMFTIWHFQNRLEGLSLGFVGDLKFGRTVNSLVALLSYFPSQTFYFVSHDSLRLSPEKVALLKAAGHTVIESNEMEAIIPYIDVLYMTRVQEERFSSKEAYEKVKDHFILNRNQLGGAKNNISILHPLPRVNEIAEDVDTHPGAQYFNQAEFGVVTRMAILADMLDIVPF